MKLYYFCITIKDGEHEYSYTLGLRSRNATNADKRARQYAKTFLGNRMKWMDDETLEPDNGYEYRYVEYSGVSETTEQELVNRLMI